MRKMILAIWIGLSLFASVPKAQEDVVAEMPTWPVRVLLTGEYSDDDIAGMPADGWLALTRDDKASALQPATIGLEEVRSDPAFQGEPYVGKKVSATPSEGLVVLLQGAGLRAGKIEEAAVTGPMTGVQTKTIQFAGQTYTLETEGSCDDRRQSCLWVLSQGERKQTLADLRVSRYMGELSTDAETTGLLWAGDLDGDGKVDLVLDVADHENAIVNVRVFLSSRAGQDEIVGQAGVFDPVGC